MWFSDHSKNKTNSLDHSGKMIAGVTSYEILIGEGNFTEISNQARLPHSVLRLVRELALKDWEKIDSETN